MKLELPDTLVDTLVDAIADRIAARLGDSDARQPSPWMRTEAAIEYTQIPAGTFRNMMAAGEIPSHGGRTKLFHRDELDQALLGYARPQGPARLRRAG